VHRKKNNTNSDVTTSTKVLCRAARIAETITAGCPTYIKFTQAVNKTSTHLLLLLCVWIILNTIAYWSACALVSPMWAYIIATWWLEGGTWTFT